MARILIVEDETSLANLLAGILKREGHEVLVAANAADGIELGVGNEPDLIIADWLLKSRIHGGEMSRRIHTACPHVKTIIITGHPEVASRARSWCECIDEVIEKPFHIERILRAVRRILPETELYLAKMW